MKMPLKAVEVSCPAVCLFSGKIEIVDAVLFATVVAFLVMLSGIQRLKVPSLQEYLMLSQISRKVPTHVPGICYGPDRAVVGHSYRLKDTHQNCSN